jgi:tRNA 2-thiouridine synthesizing protein A
MSKELTPENHPEGHADMPDETCRLDITRDTCPMTFVRTRLALDRMAPGEVLLVTLRGEEPRRNVPRTATEQGHQVLAQDEDAAGDTRLWIRKSG